MKIMFFFLDEPQILPGKKQTQNMDLSEEEVEAGAVYIPYKVEPEKDEIADLTGALYGYPEEWNHSIGLSYELRSKREAAISRITARDILMNGVVRDNPLIGHIPTRVEIEEELEELLLSM